MRLALRHRRDSRTIHLLLPVLPQAKKPWAVPCGSGDRSGDGRQAGVGRALPGKPLGDHRHGVARTLIFADQDRAGLEPSVELRSRLPAARQSVEKFLGLTIEAAEGPLL